MSPASPCKACRSHLKGKLINPFLAIKAILYYYYYYYYSHYYYFYYYY